MKKEKGKIVFLLIAALAILSLPSCSPSGSSESDVPVQQETVEPTERDATAPLYYFEDGVLVSQDVRIEILGWKIVEPGDGPLVDSPEIVFEYDVTSLSGSDAVTPATAWFAMFTAIQDNNENYVNTLDTGWFYDEEYFDSAYETLKEGGTVRNSVSYVLDDTTTPVTLVANRGIGGELLGEQSFDIASTQ